MARLTGRLAALEQRRKGGEMPVLDLILTFKTEEERAKAEAEHGSQEGPVRLHFELREDRKNEPE